MEGLYAYPLAAAGCLGKDKGGGGLASMYVEERECRYRLRASLWLLQVIARLLVSVRGHLTAACFPRLDAAPRIS